MPLRKYANRWRLNNNTPLPEDDVKRIMRDVCLGLDELHSRGIVHLDIKPENILESFHGKFKIADLGMARLQTKIMEDKSFPDGDCRYQAKETLNDDPACPIPDLTKADIYSLGVTIYELIEGMELEKKGNEWFNLQLGEWSFSEKAISHYSADFLEVVRSMLDTNPDKRPSTSFLLQNFLQSDQEREMNALMKENEALKIKMSHLEEALKKMGYERGVEDLLNKDKEQE
eukprot:CAMPEP_0170552744 /NCGR_PEP_ID=MMETSP0211-20121228/10638_1 /TAXON_ID=311385 /ORGANISM="Pseudokeronopsis sp., Strain OXSARD2" /LENGTH=229 /DNA_ID=CAMNT_0010860695 /DNA_START=500 /DNA_END=1189 /DNA_ORIENTATION=+